MEVKEASGQAQCAVMVDTVVKKHGVWCCEKKEQCRSQGFLLTSGLGWGVVPVGTPWRQRHDEVCGGRLIQIVGRNNPS